MHKDEIEAVCCPLLQEWVYGVVPPLGAVVAVPSQTPKQLMFVLLPLATNTAGSVTTLVAEPVQALKSVTVTLYGVACAHKFDMVPGGGTIPPGVQL
jgi:hypothetical protein